MAERELGVTLQCCDRLLIIPVQLSVVHSTTADGRPCLRLHAEASDDELMRRARAHVRQHE